MLSIDHLFNPSMKKQFYNLLIPLFCNRMVVVFKQNRIISGYRIVVQRKEY